MLHDAYRSKSSIIQNDLLDRGAPATALSSSGTGDVAGKSIRNLGSFKASSEDAQRDPLYHADSQRTLELAGTATSSPKPLAAVETATPLITVEPVKTPKRERGRSHHRHSHRRKRHSDRSTCKRKLMASPAASIVFRSHTC